MKTKKIALTIIAALGTWAVAEAQVTYTKSLTLNADNQQGWVASRIYLNSHDNYRGAGIFTLGQTNNWFFGNPYTDHPNSFIIGVGDKNIGADQIAQKEYAKFYINSNGKVGIGTTSPTEKLSIHGGNLSLESYAYQSFKIGNTKGYIWGNHDYNGALGAVFHDDLVLSTNWQGVTNNTDNFSGNGTFLGNNAISLGRNGIRLFTTENSPANTVPIQRMVVNNSGNVGIGTSNPGTYKLAVNGTVRAKEVIVDTNWSDFVFEPTYRLRPLSEVESHIEDHGHLPDVPSASTVQSNGLSVGEAQKIMMQKIEELTLYMIDQEKKNREQEREIQELKELLRQQDARNDSN